MLLSLEGTTLSIDGRTFDLSTKAGATAAAAMHRDNPGTLINFSVARTVRSGFVTSTLSDLRVADKQRVVLLYSHPGSLKKVGNVGDASSKHAGYNDDLLLVHLAPSALPACTPAAFVTRSGAISAWRAGGGATKSFVTLRPAIEHLAKLSLACGSHYVVVGAHEELPWGSARDVAAEALGAARAADPQSHARMVIVLVDPITPGQKVSLD